MKTTGYYGKTSARGDFISHRLPRTFVNVWDDWAQQLVVSCQHSNPERFDEIWYQLPCYRFALSAGLAGENAWLGIMLPSSDSVGRKFPLCFARAVSDNAVPASALTGNSDYFTAIETLIRQLHQSDYDYSRLDSQLDAIDQQHQPAEERTDSTDQTTLQSTPDALALRLGARLAPGSAHLDTFNHRLLTATCGAYSLWITSDISPSTHETLLFEGLPDQTACSALFDGNFSNPRWTNIIVDRDASQTRGQALSTPAAAVPAANAYPEDTIAAPLSGPIEADLLEFDDEEESITVPWDR